MAQQMLVTQLQAFFNQYGQALISFDANNIIDSYATPFLMMSDEQVNAFTDLDVLRNIFGQGATVYQAYGFAKAIPEVKAARSVSGSIIQATVHWRYLNTEGNLIYDCDYEYLLRTNEAKELKIHTTIAINEPEKLAALVKQRPGSL